MDAYFFLSVHENEDLLRAFMQGDSMGSRYFLEHTAVMYGAIQQRPAAEGGGLNSFVIAAQGEYSVGLVEFGIGRESAWEEALVSVPGGEARYYRNKDTGMEIAIPSPALMLMGSGVGERLAELYVGASSPVREDTLAILESHSAGFYLPRTAKTGLPPLLPPNAGLPLKEALLLADPAVPEDNGYAVSGSLKFATDRDAMGAAFMLRLAFSGLMSSQGKSLAEIRQTLKVAPEGDTIQFSGITFPKETAQQMFMTLMGSKRE
jgi:hypothetical protein